ncbi:MAG: iron-containing alcohol dehydrogenase, partial [Opitutae bacterium]|nr:iron-containing alcohol dehydrogenase [Opitutae bacterium]
MKFQFATAGQIIFGNGSIDKLPAQVAEIGKRPFVITGSRPERHESVLSGLKSKSYALAREPTVPLLKEAVTQAREAGADCIIGLGG